MLQPIHPGRGESLQVRFLHSPLHSRRGDLARVPMRTSMAKGALVPMTFTLLLVAEARAPLRRRVERRARRLLRNLAVAAFGALAITLLERPLVNRATHLVERRRWGLLQRLGLGPRARLLLGVAAMDYTLYGWHVLTHKAGWLWRLHRVHHADLDLDASTALRFHFAELVASIPWRLAQILLLGIDQRGLELWQRALMLSVLFHHSNVRLPRRVEALLSRVIMTPRLHGIHHSKVRSERDANWSSGLSLWDVLHGTFRDDVTQDRITIGAEGLSRPEQVTLRRLLLLAT
jgi:sterol desaturase/sphingolipid hydroxylase (fatty acid hydroxylase superfamily)